jgi:hypothetical protein
VTRFFVQCAQASTDRNAVFDCAENRTRVSQRYFINSPVGLWVWREVVQSEEAKGKGSTIGKRRDEYFKIIPGQQMFLCEQTHKNTQSVLGFTFDNDLLHYLASDLPFDYKEIVHSSSRFLSFSVHRIFSYYSFVIKYFYIFLNFFLSTTLFPIILVPFPPLSFSFCPSVLP